MSKSTNTWVALLRAIGPATHKKMTMQQLRDSCHAAGFDDLSTYIESGNLLFKSSLPKTKIHKTLVNILSNHDLTNVVILRKPSELQSLVVSAPLREAASKRPSHLLTVFFNRRLNQKAISGLLLRNGPERLEVLNREICIDYVEGVAGLRLTPAVIDKTIGQPGTARNWNTLKKLVDLSKR